ncbi:MAG: glyoxylate/hydroxypyruvate reductase A [Steroidobacteraceae bacterium]
MRGAVWRDVFAQRTPQWRFDVWPTDAPLAEVRYLVAWQADRGLLAQLPALELFFCTGAGVDHLDFAAIPADVPIVRMLDPGIVEGVVEYATLAVLAAHRQWPLYLEQQRAALWRPHVPLPAAQRRVGVLGLGRLGCAVLARLAGFGFTLRGWNGSARQIAGVDCFSGVAGLAPCLAGCDIVVNLLPGTARTRHLLDAERLAALPRGAQLVNLGRGSSVDTRALRAALDSGHLAGAVLDVTEQEPLPQSDPLWQHPRVMLTPHIAAMTRPETAAAFVMDSIGQHQRGEPLAGLVDRARGY